MPTLDTPSAGGRPAPFSTALMVEVTAQPVAGRRRAFALGTTAVLLLMGLTGCSLGRGDQAATPAPTTSAPTASISPATPRATPGAPIPASPAPRPERTRPAGPPVIPTPGATPAVFRTATAEIGPVVWTTRVDPTTKAPRDRVGTFRDDARTLYAALPVTRLAAGTELVATWSYNGTPLAGFDSRLRAEREERDVWVEFHVALTGAEPWPSGTYAVEVTVDGRLGQAAAVVVEPVVPS